VITLEVPEGLLPVETLREWVDLLVRLVEAAGALIIFAGAAVAFVRFAALGLRRRHEREFTSVRLGLGRYLLLGLEFQLASDLLKTTVSPSFEAIGQLAAIAAIRTALNFFVGREIAAEEQEVEGERRPP
jgi:uncharacterized membrane protein